MAHQQSWPLSQEANKPSGTCSCCIATRQLHLKDKTVHLHGPRMNRCPGSLKPPLSQPPSNPPLAIQQSQPVIHSTTSINTPLLPSTQQTSNTSSLTHPKVDYPIIKHIPKSARPACGAALSSLLHRIAQSPDDLTAWSSLFHFSGNTLSKPPRGGKKHNLASVIKKRADDALHNVIGGSTISSPPILVNLPPPLRKSDDARSLATRISAKIEDGNVRAAVRIICSEDSEAVADQDPLLKLEDKHPSAPINRSLVHETCSAPQFLFVLSPQVQVAAQMAFALNTLRI